MTLCISQFQQCPSPPPRANPRTLAFFLKNGQIARGGGHINCLNAPGWGRRKRGNAPPPGSSPSNRSLYSQATLSVKNQDILNDLSSHFTLARSVLKIASFEFANLLYFNSTFMNLKIARLVLNAKCEVVVFTQSSRQ